VVVDDYLPYDSESEKPTPLFASSSDDEFWVCLLEKAWAKLHGSYAMIVGGTPEQVYSHLTNKPTYICAHAELKDEEPTKLKRSDKYFQEEIYEEKEELWQKLAFATNMNCLMVCESVKNLGKGDNFGILPNHTYQLFSVHEVVTNKIERIVKVKNHTEDHIWTGKWSPSKSLEDQDWSTPSIRQLGELKNH
jgi:calpain-15